MQGIKHARLYSFESRQHLPSVVPQEKQSHLGMLIILVVLFCCCCLCLGGLAIWIFQFAVQFISGIFGYISPMFAHLPAILTVI
jgi:hypothetical protein